MTFLEWLLSLFGFKPKLAPVPTLPPAPIGPIVYVTAFSDSFDDLAKLDDLIVPDASRWTGYERLPKTTVENAISIESKPGGKFLRFHAQRSVAGSLSKMELKKQNFRFTPGMTVEISLAVYLAGTAPQDGMTILDLEGPPDSLGEPGIRLMLVGGSGQYLSVDPSKYGQPRINQAAVIFPRDRWIRLRWRILLAQDATGRVDLWQDDVLIISKGGVQTMPAADLTPGVYDDLQIGVTAGSYQSAVDFGADDVAIGLVQ